MERTKHEHTMIHINECIYNIRLTQKKHENKEKVYNRTRTPR